MVRLTARMPDGTAYVCSETGNEGVGYFTTQRRLPELIAKLAAYEDTGLEPSDIKSLTGLAVFVHENGLDRIKEWFKAEEQGRLVVLPCKVGDTVYCIRDSAVEKGWGIKKVQPYIITDTFLAHMAGVVGKTVFLTRKEAEAALREEQA